MHALAKHLLEVEVSAVVGDHEAAGAEADVHKPLAVAPQARVGAALAACVEDHGVDAGRELLRLLLGDGVREEPFSVIWNFLRCSVSSCTPGCFFA